MRGMKAMILVMTTAASVMANGKCTDVPITWSLSFTYNAAVTAVPSAIYSDGAGGSNPSYVNGVDGVSALIICGDNDANLSTVGSKRSIGWNFGQVVAPNSNTPSWSGSSFFDPSILVIRNILYTPPGYVSTQAFTFTTRMNSQLSNKGTKTTLFHLRMENPLVQAVTTAPADPSANSPYTDAAVIVQHIPATATSPETWVVFPDPSASPAETGTLLQDQKNGSTLNTGQYTMPFQFTISRQ